MAEKYTQAPDRRFLHFFAPSCLALAVSGAVASLDASAQEAGSGSSATGTAARMAPTFEEVVVTARRRSENLSRVPTAITVISAEELKQRSIRTDSDLQFAVPGLTIRQTQGNNSLTYSIRGQSADTFSGSPSAVIAYLDEVPLSISGASTFYDLESVQVLKGPQGTLFGRNTTGGAVLYTTAKPTNETEGMLRVRGGNYELREVEGMLNIPWSTTRYCCGARSTPWIATVISTIGSTVRNWVNSDATAAAWRSPSGRSIAWKIPRSSVIPRPMAPIRGFLHLQRLSMRG